MTPLSGIRVLELGQIITAPLAGAMLGDMGAEVLKVENVEGGDPFRSFRGGVYSGHFAAYNRGKRSIAVDLRNDEGRAILLALIARSDVLLENFRPDVMARLHLDTATLERTNPRLVHASITGFGASGPYVERPAFDTVGMALSGMGSLFFDPDDPQVRGPTLVDNVSGMYCAYGIMGALFERARSGRGRRVEVNMLEAAIAFMPDPFANYHQHGLPQDQYTRAAASQSYVLRCADGRLIALHLSSPQKFWDGLMRAVARPEIAHDPRFGTRVDRMTHYLDLRRALAEAFATRPAAEWMARLAAEDVPFAPVNTIPEVEHDPQVQSLGIFRDVPGPDGKPQRLIARAVQIGGERGPIDRAAPLHGEHTIAVLDELGWHADDIARLRAARVIATGGE